MSSFHPFARMVEASEYAMTHCRRCEAVWTRKFENGAMVIMCFLDLMPVSPDMTHCDRYDPRDD